MQTRSGGSMHINMLIFLETGLSKADILQFFKFSKWLLPPPSWIVKFANFYWLRVCGGPRRITVPNFVKMVVQLQRYWDFSNFQKWPPRHLGFLKSRNFIGYLGGEARDASAYQFRQNRSIGCKDMKIFGFFKMAAAAILNFQIRKIFLADVVLRAHTHNCTKFHQNRSFRCGDIAIFQIFKMAAAAMLDFWNRENLLVIGVERVEMHQRAKFR